MYSNAKAEALIRDLADRLTVRLAANAGLNTISQGFYTQTIVEASGGNNVAQWPYLMLTHNGNAAEGQPVVYIQLSNVDAVSKDIFGNSTYAYAPTVLMLGYELTGAAGAYTFTVTSANATAGAIYQDSVTGQQFLVGSTLVSGTTLVTAGRGGNPSVSGTLNKISGTGDATITFSAFSDNLFTGATNPIPAHSDLATIEFEAQTCGCEWQLIELANGTAVTGATVNAAAPLVDIQPLYWPTKSV
jgi:hypothetical protein